MVNVTINLTETQAGMLLFFAGKRDMPCGNVPTTQSLITRALLEPSPGSRRYRLTALGRKVAQELGKTASRHSAKQ